MAEEVSMKNTKKEMLNIIHQLQLEMEAKERKKLNPEKVKKEKKKTEMVQKADQTIDADLVNRIHTLKLSINQELTGLSQKIQTEAEQYKKLKLAIEIKQAELETLYGIEKEAAKLATILEAQQQTREKFTAEMAEKQEKLENLIAETKKGWEREKTVYREALAEEKVKNKKERIREQEEYDYQLKRSRELEQNRFNDEMVQAEKELKEQKKVFEQFQQTKNAELTERENQVTDREQVMDELQQRVNAFPEELQKAVDSAVQVARKQAKEYAGHKETILNKTFEGERNVLQTKITSLESLVKDQTKQIDKLIMQQEKAYQQVQDIAGKAVAGATERPQNITFKTAEAE